MKFIDLTGLKFGRLLVLRRAENILSKSRWACRCACGNIAVIRAECLIRGKTLSCHCLRRERLVYKGTHRETANGTVTKEFTAWANMKRRCHLKTDYQYKNYGARGILVCARWRNSFSDFLLDVGRAPSLLHSVDRINNDGNYEPGNVRWATSAQQSENKRTNVYVELNGVKKRPSEWAKYYRVTRQAIHQRAKREKAGILAKKGGNYV